MKYKIVASCLVILVSAFSFSYGAAQTVDHTSDHAHATSDETNLKTNLQVTTVGSTNWVQMLVEPAGTTTAWLLSYQNDGPENVPKLIMNASMPLGHTLIPGSVMWFDANFPTGYKLSDSGLFGEGVDVGGVVVGGNGFIRFRTSSAVDAACGTKTTAGAFFSYNGRSNQHEASVATPECSVLMDEEVSGPVQPAQTPTTEPDTTHQHTDNSQTHQTSENEVSSAAPQSEEPDSEHATHDTINTSTVHSVTQADVQAVTTSSAPTDVKTTSTPATQSGHTTHEVSTVQSATVAPQQMQQPTAQAPDHNTQVSGHSTVNPAASSPSTPAAAQSETAVSHTAHSSVSQQPVVAAAVTTVATSHTSHTAPAEQSQQSTQTSASHDVHTLTKAGGNPIWVILGTLATGYLISLLRMRRHLTMNA